MALTRQVAVDYAADRTHINAVCPGAIATAMIREWLDNEDVKTSLHEMTPWPNLGTPEEVAKAVLVLSGDLASFMTGSFLQVDGGFIAK